MGTPSGVKASGKEISVAEKQRRAVELRRDGWTYQNIADEVGYAGHQGARKAVQSALKKLVQEPAEELRSVQHLQIQSLLKKNIEALNNTVDPYRITRITEAVLKLLEREAKLLGLDSPQKTEDHHIHTITVLAQQIAAEQDIDALELIAEAEAIVRSSRDA